MSPRRDKKRIDPEGSPTEREPVDEATEPTRRRRKDARRSRRSGGSGATDAGATPIPDALAAITGEVPVAAAGSRPGPDVEPSPEAAEIAALTTRHRAAALTPSGPEPIAPRMRAFRFPALLVVLALLVGAVLVERREAEPTQVATAPTDLSRLAPVASAPDARSSTFYCAGGTARGSTDPIGSPAEDPAGTEEGATEGTTPPGSTPAVSPTEVVVPVVAEHTVTIANLSDREQQATVTAVPSEGDPVVETTTVPARTRATIVVSDLVTAPFAAALVETDGGSVAVEHQVEGPTGRSVAPCASSASDSWYFPAGTTRLGTRHLYSVFNPFPQQAVVDFSFMVEEEGGRQATRESDRLEGIVVPPTSVVTVDITDIITVRNQVATTVATRSGLGRVVVDQLQVSDGRSEWPENLALTLGAPAPATTWLFADNRPLGEGVTTTFVAFNPGTTDAELEIYVEVDAQAVGSVIEPFVVTVRAGQYAVVPIGDDTRIPEGIGAFVVAVSRNEVPIVVERVMRQAEPLDPDGAAFTMGMPVLASDWLVPVGGIEGQESMQVSIANPSVSETVTLTVEAVGDGDAAPLDDFDQVSLAPGARTVVDLSDAQGAAVLMLRITSSGPVVVGQSFAFDDPGTLSDLGAFPVTGTLVLPGGEVTDRGEPAEAIEPEPFDGTLPPATAPPGSTPGTVPEAPPETDPPAAEETTTTTVTEAPAPTDPATGLPIDPAAVPTSPVPG